MTNNPNIKKAILENVLEEAPAGGEDKLMGNMRELADQRGWEIDRVVNHVNQLYCLTCGTSPVYPWPYDEQAARERLESYR